MNKDIDIFLKPQFNGLFNLLYLNNALRPLSSRNRYAWCLLFVLWLLYF